MKRFLFTIYLLLSAIGIFAVEPYCLIRHFDESNGLSQRSVKKIVTDTTGIVWIATWNGLNRFDGYDFAVVRPGAGESARRYSSRYRDLHALADGSVWCRIDDRIVRLDPSTNRFRDVHSELEEKLGRPLHLSEWTVSGNGSHVVMKCDGEYLTLTPGGELEKISSEKPIVANGAGRFRRPGDYPGFPLADQAYGEEREDGSIWIVTRTGQVAFASRRGEKAEVIADLGVTDRKVRYSATDANGGVWFCSNQGAHRVEMGLQPFETLSGGNNGRVLSACRDNKDRIWVAEPDRQALSVYDDKLEGAPRFVDRTGRLHDSFVSFGRPVYSLSSDPSGERIWVGCKPDGLFVLTPAVDGYDVRKVIDGNVYDIVFDSLGRLWIATIGSGILRIDSPDSEKPVVTVPQGLPADSDGARRISIISDSLMLVSTTGGLLALDPLRDKVYLHVTEVDRISSLGCIAVTDAVVGGDGQIYVSTESGGVSIMKGDPFGKADFIPLQEVDRSQSDVAFSLLPSGRSDLFTVNPGQITRRTIGNGTDSLSIFSDGFWKSHRRFTEMKPFDLGDGRMLLGTYSGGIVTRFDSEKTSQPKVIFTSASVQGRRDTLLTPASDGLILGRTERSLTLRFAALDYSDPGEVRYSVRINGGEWSSPSISRSLSLYDLDPGRYEIEVRSTDHFGWFDGSPCRITVTVTPKWHETLAARIVFWLLGLIMLGGIWRVWSYIRSIKRRQHDILAAYLKLVEETGARVSEESEENTGTADGPEPPEVSEADREFMKHVMDYVQAHLSDPDADVDAMASDVGVSRSGLTRKMKSLMGVSPADFLRQSRLKRACTLLSTTAMPVKEIAFDCGFSDLNYFGKCFKSAYGKSPTGWRRDER